MSDFYVIQAVKVTLWFLVLNTLSMVIYGDVTYLISLIFAPNFIWILFRFVVL